jgi:hypothetical protein
MGSCFFLIQRHAGQAIGQLLEAIHNQVRRATCQQDLPVILVNLLSMRVVGQTGQGQAPKTMELMIK